MRSFFVFAARGVLLNKLSFAETDDLLHRFTRFVLTVLFLNAFAGCGDLTHRCRRRRCAGLLRTAVFHLSAIALSVHALKTKAPSPKNPGRELYRIYYYNIICSLRRSTSCIFWRFIYRECYIWRRTSGTCGSIKDSCTDNIPCCNSWGYKRILSGTEYNDSNCGIADT